MNNHNKKLINHIVYLKLYSIPHNTIMDTQKDYLNKNNAYVIHNYIAIYYKVHSFLWVNIQNIVMENIHDVIKELYE